MLLNKFFGHIAVLHSFFGVRIGSLRPIEHDSEDISGTVLHCLDLENSNLLPSLNSRSVRLDLDQLLLCLFQSPATMYAAKRVD